MHLVLWIHQLKLVHRRIEMYLVSGTRLGAFKQQQVHLNLELVLANLMTMPQKVLQVCLVV